MIKSYGKIMPVNTGTLFNLIWIGRTSYASFFIYWSFILLRTNTNASLYTWGEVDSVKSIKNEKTENIKYKIEE